MSLFIGRLGRDVRTADLEDAFRRYGKMNRCEVKGNGFGFVDFDDKRDAEDACSEMNGREVRGSRIVVEWAKGPGRRNAGSDECFKCGRPGHFARDCERGGSDRGGGGGGRGRSPDRYRRRSPSPYRRRSPSPRRRRSPSPRRSRSRSPIRRSRSPVRRSSRSPARSPPRSPARSPARSPVRSPARSPSPP